MNPDPKWTALIVGGCGAFSSAPCATHATGGSPGERTELPPPQSPLSQEWPTLCVTVRRDKGGPSPKTLRKRARLGRDKF